MALASAPLAQLEQNRIQLDNGGEEFWFLQSTFVGADPVNGDYDGDLYYKVFPEEVNMRCSGVWTWTGVEYVVYANDWNTGADLYSLVLSPANETAFGTFEPEYGTAEEIILPGFPADWCDLTGELLPPNFCPLQPVALSIRETYIDTLGGSSTFDPAFEDLVQGDWALTHIFPEGLSVDEPAVNTCGEAGDFTLMWLGSTDLPGLDGENQPDWTGLPGASAYGGFRVGGAGLGFVPDAASDTAVLPLLVDGPTLNVKVDLGLTGLGLPPLVEIGLAGLNPQIGIDANGDAVGTGARVGVQVFSESSKPVNNADGMGSFGVPYVGVLFANLGPTLLDMGTCLTLPLLKGLALNPSDPILTTLTSPAGVQMFTDGDPLNVAGGNANVDWDGDGTPDDGVYNSNLVSFVPGPDLIDVQISLQAFTSNAVTTAAVGSQVVRVTLRANN